MMSDACREMRAALGAAALSGLDAADDPALRAHLDGCAECRAELRELSSVARALPLADPRRGVEAPAEPPPGLGDRVRDRLAQERNGHRNRARRRTLLAVAAALVAVLAVVATVVALRDANENTTQVTFPTTAGASGRARLYARETGTEVALHVRGLHDGDAYWLWLTDAHGDRMGAGTFLATDGEIDVTLTSAMPLDDARRIWITDDDDATVLDTMLPTG
jgi:hypothetical protein